MSGEARLMLACVRQFVTEAGAETVASGFDDGVDWRALLELADAHSVMPLVYSVLGSDRLRAAGTEWRSCFERQARSNLVHTAALVNVLKLFGKNQIDVIALKGPVLAAWAYGDLALRSYRDVDLLIREHDVLRARDVLESSGYRLHSAVHSSSPSALLRSKDGELIFESPAGTHLDIHWKLFPSYFPEAIPPKEIWHDLSYVEISGYATATLSPENLLCFLGAHGGKHRWEYLGWVCDLALVVKRVAVEWARVFERARRAHIERMLLTGLSLARDLLGTELPETVRSRIGEDERVAAVAATVKRRLLTGSQLGPSSIEACGISLQMLDRFRDRLRFLNGVLIVPGEAEWRGMQMPPILYPLYYPYRALRLIVKQAAHAF